MTETLNKCTDRRLSNPGLALLHTTDSAKSAHIIASLLYVR